jgi:hypothetical protein
MKRKIIFWTIVFFMWVFITSISRVIYDLFWDTSNLPDFLWTWQFILSMVLGVILHEFVHAIFAAIYNPKGWSSIKIGFNLKKGVAYCRCTEPMKVKHWRIIAIMPLILIGMIPYIISFIFGFYPLMYLSVMMIFASCNDVTALYRISNLSSDAYMPESL